MESLNFQKWNQVDKKYIRNKHTIMKNILFLLAVLFTVASCTTVNYSEKRWSIDFREYIKDPNFTINPTDISNKDFEPIGLIKLEFYVGTNVKKEHKDHVREEGGKWTAKYYVPTLERMISLSVEEAKKIGANGIIKFDLIRKNKANGSYPVYEVTGVAVKY